MFRPLPGPTSRGAIVRTERTAEAIRRALPELIKLERYEQRAATRRDQATRRVISRKLAMNTI